ncbi:MAG TPA: hypothetical protein VLJ39_17555, partial [Tepidisphaeraceae bacterium]|nr:hypothetical protein [Tepidisphaeraceae bacterium]
PHPLRWDQLQMIAVETTSSGPYLEDLFLVLIGTADRLVIPNRAAGSDELAERLLQLPGFDREAYARAIRSTSDQSFVCWKRPRPNDAG